MNLCPKCEAPVINVRSSAKVESGVRVLVLSSLGCGHIIGVVNDDREMKAALAKAIRALS